MENKKLIYCIECEKPIKSKNELVISIKMLQPYHKDCFMNPDKLASKMNKFYGPFPLQSKFWVWLIVGNLISSIILMIETSSYTILCTFIVLCNIIFISARLSIYYSYEKHLM